MVTSEIKAIETVYHGVRFRSRIEARWAVFFDTLGVRWEYEPEAFTDGVTSYLPDFWLPEQTCWWEVKPEGTDRETMLRLQDKVGIAARATGHAVHVALGAPMVDPRTGGTCETCQPDPSDKNTFVFFLLDGIPDIKPTIEHDEQYRWFECPCCHRLDLSWDGRTRCSCRHPEGKIEYRPEVNTHSPRLHSAYSAARSHRFWEPRP